MSIDPARELLDTINRNYVMQNVDKMVGPYVADSALSVIQTVIAATTHQAYWSGYDRGVIDGKGDGYAMPEPRFTNQSSDDSPCDSIKKSIMDKAFKEWPKYIYPSLESISANPSLLAKLREKLTDEEIALLCGKEDERP